MLCSFDDIFDRMNQQDKRHLIESMIDEIHLYTQEEREQMINKKYVKDMIKKPTGKKEEYVTLNKKHIIKWEGKTDHLKYYIVDMNEAI